ncbi:acetylxylan esterase 2 [Fusarium albosuccineum]|uniref:Acetylxylan esterase 2 n=1 Tax=Fusarium albosuccineum TaxID=1237068 RepID=A0A8H4PM49_9HYPO|nr:acetylxylan esterase 2 [Fusarium albosuccineum]
MHPLALSVVLLATTTLASNSNSVSKLECADGLFMVVARGTTEEKGTGVTGNITDDIADRINGSIVHPLDYPATLLNPFYTKSEKEGVENMQQVLTNYHESCPDGKTAVLGYSQGAQVAGDAICGSDSDSVEEKPDPLSTDILKDNHPNHLKDSFFNQGSSKKDGIWARDNFTLCEDNYGDAIHSYCDTGDKYCDQGDIAEVHREYVQNYGDEVADFVVAQYEKSAKGGNKTATSETPTSSADRVSATASESGVAENAASAVLPSLFAIVVIALVICSMA